MTYTLEPAGSHGVWGLDDHSFLPYIFGSAQLSPAISTPADVAAEGSLPDAPNPPDVAKAAVVERERKKNMYFNAVGFIYDVKRGPFWEHSPILFDISGVKAGWAKINKVRRIYWALLKNSPDSNFSGNVEDVQCRGTIQIPGSATLSLRISLLLGGRPSSGPRSCVGLYI